MPSPSHDSNSCQCASKKNLYFFYLYFSYCLMNCLLNFPLHPFPLCSSYIVVRYFHLLCFYHVFYYCLVFNYSCWIVHFCYKIYDDGVMKDVNMKMANVKKWMHWCCERPIIKKMVNAKKQTQCYNTKRWCKNPSAKFTCKLWWWWRTNEAQV
jgi:hypothetical protein